MNELEKNSIKTPEEILFQERESFVKENYPINKSHYDMDELINSSLDDFDVIEKRGKNNNIEGLLTYKIMEDNYEKCNYCALGLALVREDLSGEGVVDELYDEIIKIAEKNDCNYMAATADTEMGEKLLVKLGFDEFEDPINKRVYLRKELK